MFDGNIIISGAYSRKLSRGDINQLKNYGYFIRLKEEEKSSSFTSGGEQQMIAVARLAMQTKCYC